MSRLSNILRVLPEYQTYRADVAAVRRARKAMREHRNVFAFTVNHMVAVKMRDASKAILCDAIRAELGHRMMLNASAHLRMAWHRGAVETETYHSTQAILVSLTSELAEVL